MRPVSKKDDEVASFAQTCEERTGNNKRSTPFQQKKKGKYMCKIMFTTDTELADRSVCGGYKWEHLEHESDKDMRWYDFEDTNSRVLESLLLFRFQNPVATWINEWWEIKCGGALYNLNMLVREEESCDHGCA